MAELANGGRSTSRRHVLGEHTAVGALDRNPLGVEAFRALDTRRCASATAIGRAHRRCGIYLEGHGVPKEVGGDPEREHPRQPSVSSIAASGTAQTAYHGTSQEAGRSRKRRGPAGHAPAGLAEEPEIPGRKGR